MLNLVTTIRPSQLQLTRVSIYFTGRCVIQSQCIRLKAQNTVCRRAICVGDLKKVHLYLHSIQFQPAIYVPISSRKLQSSARSLGIRKETIRDKMLKGVLCIFCRPSTHPVKIMCLCSFYNAFNLIATSPLNVARVSVDPPYILPDLWLYGLQ